MPPKKKQHGKGEGSNDTKFSEQENTVIKDQLNEVIKNSKEYESMTQDEKKAFIATKYYEFKEQEIMKAKIEEAIKNNKDYESMTQAEKSDFIAKKYYEFKKALPEGNKQSNLDDVINNYTLTETEIIVIKVKLEEAKKHDKGYESMTQAEKHAFIETKYREFKKELFKKIIDDRKTDIGLTENMIEMIERTARNIVGQSQSIKSIIENSTSSEVIELYMREFIYYKHYTVRPKVLSILYGKSDKKGGSNKKGRSDKKGGNTKKEEKTKKGKSTKK